MMKSLLFNLWIILGGACAAVGMVVGMAFWQRRQRRLRGVRPPVSRNLLRPPGHTLSEKLAKLDDRLMPLLGMAMGAGAVLAFVVATLSSIVVDEEVRAYVAENGLSSLVLSRRLLPHLLSIGWLGIAFVLVFLYGTLKCNATLKESSNLHLARGFTGNTSSFAAFCIFSTVAEQRFLRSGS